MDEPIKKEENKKPAENLGDIFAQDNGLEAPEGAKELKKEKEPFSEDGEAAYRRALKKKIEETDLAQNQKQQAAIQAQDISSLEEKEKIENLLKIAEKKGIVYAVHVAKKMNDPYVLDKLHDILAKEEYYKRFVM